MDHSPHVMLAGKGAELFAEEQGLSIVDPEYFYTERRFKSLQKAIEAEIENPGTYHVNFFEKLKKFIIQLRKQVAESGNWLEISNQRKVAQRHYWGNVKKSGTKYMLSHDRSVATQPG